MQSHYRCVEAIVAKLASYPELISLTGHGLSDDDNDVHHIGEDMPDVTGRTPYIGIKIVRDDPLDAQAAHAGWLRSRVDICVYDKSQAGLTGVLILDYISDLLRLENHGMDRNRRYLDFSNESIQNRETRFTRRVGFERNDERDVWEGKIIVDMIWLDRPCDGVCKPVVLDECETNVDCGDNCP